MKRRDFVTLLGGAAATWPLAARAQTNIDPLRVGFLGAVSAADYADRVESLRAGLRDLGYVEGKTLQFETRWAENQYEKLAPLAAELVRLGSHVLVTHGTPGTRAAREATAVVPIVMAVNGDAVATKLVDSFARPGGNITGSSYFSPELNAKQFELLKEIAPGIRRVAFLINSANPLTDVNLPQVEKVAHALGMEMGAHKAQAPIDFEGAFVAMTDRGAEAVVIANDAVFSGNSAGLAALAEKYKMLTVGEPPLALAGGLIGYGPNLLEMFRRAAYFIDKIAKGAKPSELPVEQPTKFELIINLKASKSLGLIVPASMLARADEVIE